MPAPGEVRRPRARSVTAASRPPLAVAGPYPTPCPSYAAPQVAKNLEQAMALKEQGNQHFKEGDYPKAIAAYHQVRAGAQAAPQSTASRPSVHAALSPPSHILP